MKSASDSKIHGPIPSAQTAPANEQEETILDNIMEVFSMIMQKGYKHTHDALCYEANEDEGIIIRFRHSSTLDMEDHDAAIKQHEAFYHDMRDLLSQMEKLDTDLDIYPGALTLHAESGLALIDGLAQYFRQENCTLEISDTAKPKPSEQKLLAGYGSSLAIDNKEAYDYYLDSVPSRGFVSIDHLNATIAARALCDIPVSLEMLRRKIIGGVKDVPPISAQEHRIMLEDSFNGSAYWCNEPPELPSIDSSSFLFERERHQQLASAIHCIMSGEYNLAREINRSHIRTFITQVEKPAFDIRFKCAALTPGKLLGEYFAKFHAFAEDFRKACGNGSDVTLIPAEDKNLLTIRYKPDDLFRVLTNMIAEQHPGNLMAQTHLRAVAHIRERIDMGCPANRLN